jgi:hypothetical protein
MMMLLAVDRQPDFISVCYCKFTVINRNEKMKEINVIDTMTRDPESERQWGLECLEEAIRCLYRTWTPGETLQFTVDVKGYDSTLSFEVTMKELGRKE